MSAERPGNAPGPDAVAIVGAAIRFPAAPDLPALARLLHDGRCAMRPVDPARLAASPHAAVAEQPGYVAMSSVMDDIERFDAGFFGLTPREALLIDPQQRQILECAWLAFEHAGIVPGDDDDRRTAVFTSVSFSSYLSYFLLPRLQAGLLDIVEVGLSNNVDYAPARVSHKLDLKGPSVAVQTACSSSLVATHLACRSLAEGECDLGLIAASSITVPSGLGYRFSDKGMVSKDGYCRPFARDASGTIFASGAGAMLLRRLDDALAAGDRVLGVIRGSAINNDGGQRVGFTAPNVDGQSAVVAEALQAAGVDPSEISYIEAHGTGTPLGDPIEIAALNDAYGLSGPLPAGTIPIGAAKGNLGHLDTAAGLAGLMKILLAFEAEMIPPTLHAEDPNPALDLSRTPFRLMPRAEAWRRGTRRRIAGLSSFGMGGANAHAVIEEPPPPPPTAPGRACELIVFSGRDDADAEAMGKRLGDYIDGTGSTPLSDVGHTLRAGRRPFGVRRFVVAASPAEAADALKAGRVHRISAGSPSTRVAFVLPGQGSQYPRLGAQLAEAEPAFRAHHRRLRDGIRQHGGPDIGQADLSADAARATGLAQPLLFVAGVALGATLRDWGLTPDLYIGHSIGEIAAACLAGALSEDDACRLVVARAEAMATAPKGALVQLMTDRAVAFDLVAESNTAGPGILAPVAYNAPNIVVVGGDHDAVDRLIRASARAGIEATLLKTSHAFHTPLMRDAADAVRAAASALSARPPAIPIISTLTGQRLPADRLASADYWAQQMLSPVRFADAVATAIDHGVSLFMELGPPGGLAACLPQIASAQSSTIVHPATALLAHARNADDANADQRVFLEAVGRLWASGRAVDWAAFEAPFTPRRRLALPGYPFKRERHWPEDETADWEGDRAAVPAQTAPPTTEALRLPRQPRPPELPSAVAPRGPIEERLATFWEELLLIAPIGREDDFIALGGASITALQLVQAAATHGYTITVRQIFDYRVLKDLAGEIGRQTEAATPVSADPTAQDDAGTADADDLDLDPETLAILHAQLNV